MEAVGEGAGGADCRENGSEERCQERRVVGPKLGGDAIHPWRLAPRTPSQHGRDRGGGEGAGAGQESEVSGEGSRMSGDGLEDGLLGVGVAGGSG